MITQAMNPLQQAEPLYKVIAYIEHQGEPLLLAINQPHRQVWQIARKGMDENPATVSVRVMKQGGKDD
ncbi:hypothetical protein X808_17980 [Mannheimia varigena USDA-ARS-USMARC-1296]|uniref:Uncharacterized protein n=1 Tax=Mannheimia varigena USDA-ARS-USMARC-1296 TaxID=1433287 RepID=W0QGG7_9PAST|nr:hypothetical protein [Mannheimia varigena]AHG76318.1 hypothetical protein X808_17980 [Mannheimia varigena USDA-ARS-USMARC-1296]